MNSGDNDKNRIVYECPRFRVIETERLNKTGQRRTVWYLVADPWTRVVGFDDLHQIYLIREFSLARKEWVWRLPGGRVEKGEAPDIAALRELREELGLITNCVELLFEEVPTASWYLQKGYVFVAINLARDPSGTSMEDDERILVSPSSIESAIRMADEGLFDAWTEKAIRHAVLWHEKCYKTDREMRVPKHKNSGSAT